jgi:minimal PKS acyl carrier protein
MTKAFTIADLKRILAAVAGTDEADHIEGDTINDSFEALGYESLAILEAGSTIERDYGIKLDDELLDVSHTPRVLVDAINACLAGTSDAWRADGPSHRP